MESTHMPGETAMVSDVDVAGGTLRVLSFGSGPVPVIAVHGITANASCWRAVARALPGQYTVHAVDLRGRGHSAALPGPYGFDRHTSDLRALTVALDLDRPVLVGHSLGAYIALLTADAHSDLFGGLLLIDGGLPMPVPAGVDLDQLITASLGPAIARLTQSFASADAYLDFWRAHPALATSWNDDIEHYVRYDITGEPGAYRSRVAPECVTEDSRDLLSSGERISTALKRYERPLPLLRAPRGMFGEPPGLLPEELTDYWQSEVPNLSATTIPDTNHYTIMFAPASTQRIAAALDEVSSADRP
jgi:lipase